MDARVIDGPLVGAHLAALRDEGSSAGAMRRHASSLGAALVAGALEDAAAEAGEVVSPMGRAAVRRFARRITLVPILRAGLGLLDGALGVLPDDTRVGFLGMVRNEETLAPDIHMERLPAHLDDDEVVILEVMIATGGSSSAAIDVIRGAGARSIRLCGVLAAPEGLARLDADHPDVRVTVAAVDERLDERGFIIPGLGDSGDRLYGLPGG